MRAGVYAEREPAYNRDWIARKTADELLTRLLPVACHRARTDDGKKLRSRGWQHPAHPQPLRRLWYLQELCRPFSAFQFSNIHICSLLAGLARHTFYPGER